MNTRRNKYSKEEKSVVNSNNGKKQESTRKRERSREKEILSKKDKFPKDDELNDKNKNLYKISIVSASKVLLENFVDKEIDKM
jgi:hypothetical protein